MGNEAAPSALSMHVLGPFQLLVRGEPAPPLRSRQAQALLAWLALSDGRELDRAHCAEQLWPESRPDQALANLRQNLASIRTSLGDEAYRLVSSDRRSIQFDVESANIDVLEFDRCAGSEDPALWQRAVSLYRGPLLAGLPGEAISIERNHRQRKMESLLERLAGGEDEPEKYAQELLRHDSTNEIAVRRLLQIRSDRRDVAGTIRLYEEFRRTLRRLYHVEPSPETTGCYDRALAKCREANSSRPATWTPAFLRPLVGRESERSVLMERLRENRCVSLVGPGGIGKTRLMASALEASEAGIWMDCAELSQPNAGALEAALKARLGTDVQDVTVEDLLRTRSPGFVLAFDSVECAPNIVSDCIARLCRIPGLRFVCSGRAPLGVPGESVLRLGGMTEADSLAMFVALADVQASLAVELVRRLEGVPLAIEVVAPLAAAIPMPSLIQEVKRHGVLGLNRGGKLRDALELAWSRLDTPERSLLVAAATLPGPCGSAQLLRLVDRSDAELTIGGLVLKSWLNHDPAASFTPYSLSSIAREFIREKGCISTRKLVEIYAEFAEDCRRRFHARDGNERLLEISAHRQNLDFAVGAALLEGWGDEAYLLLGATWGCLLAQGRFAYVREVLNLCLNLDTGSISSKVRVTNAAGFVLRSDGRYADSLAIHRRAVDMASSSGEEQMLAESHGRCGLTLCDMGNPAAGLKEYRLALALFKQIDDRWWLATIQHEIASTYLLMGDVSAADRFLTRAMILMKDIGDPLRLAGMAEAKAEILAGEGRYEEADRFLNEALDTYRWLGFIRNQMNCNIQIAHLAKVQGRNLESVALYEETIRLAMESGYPQTALEARLRLGWALLDMGDGVAAEVNFELAHADASRTSQTVRAANAKEGLEACLRLMG